MFFCFAVRFVSLRQNGANYVGNVTVEKEEAAESTEDLSEGIPQEEDSMQIRVESDGKMIVFELNDSQE